MPSSKPARHPVDETLLRDIRVRKGRQKSCVSSKPQKFTSRYATFGFNDDAKLDEGMMWPTAFAVTELTAPTSSRNRVVIRCRFLRLQLTGERLGTRTRGALGGPGLDGLRATAVASVGS